MATMHRPGQFVMVERKRCTHCGQKLPAGWPLSWCANRKACQKRAAAKAAKRSGTGGRVGDWPIRILGRDGVVHAAEWWVRAGQYRTPCGLKKGRGTEVVDRDMTCQTCIDKIREAERARGW